MPIDAILKWCWENGFEGVLEYLVRPDRAPPNLKMTILTRLRAKDVERVDPKWTRLEVSPAILRELFARVDDGQQAPAPPPLDVDVSKAPPAVAPEQRALDLVEARMREVEALGANIKRTRDELAQMNIAVTGWENALEAICTVVEVLCDGVPESVRQGRRRADRAAGHGSGAAVGGGVMGNSLLDEADDIRVAVVPKM
jgi:hypothetical protein